MNFTGKNDLTPAPKAMSDDENILDFGEEGEDEFGQYGDSAMAEEAKGFLETYPTIGRGYNWMLGALDTLWDFAGVFQPVFKHSWVFFIVYLGVTSNKQLEWSDLVPFYGRNLMEDEDEE